MEKSHFELVILGGGPAGLTAGLYASRARIDHVLIEKGAPGGQVLTTDWVDNYPGFPEGLSGFELMERMTEHAKRFDVNMWVPETPAVAVAGAPAGSSVVLDALSVASKYTLIRVPGVWPGMSPLYSSVVPVGVMETGVHEEPPSTL